MYQGDAQLKPERRTFFKPSLAVARDRYRKKIWEDDQLKAQDHYAKAGLSGAAIGALVRKKGFGLGKAAAIGAGAGVGAQMLVRHATAGTKDQFGDRSHAGKRADSALPLAGELGAAVLAYRGAAKKLKRFGFSAIAINPANKGKFKATEKKTGKTVEELAHSKNPITKKRAIFAENAKKWNHKFSAVPVPANVMGRATRALKDIPWGRFGRSAAVGAAALGGAGALAGALAPDKDKTRIESAADGAVKDGIFGGALYGIGEPLFKKALLKKGEGLLSSKLKMIQFGYYDQVRDKKTKQWVEPLDAWSRNSDVQTGGKDVSISHRQVLRGAFSGGRKLVTGVRRGTSLANDLHGSITGRDKTDSRGRPLKKEWEKAWFQNAVTGAALGVGVLGVHGARRYAVKNPESKLGKGIHKTEEFLHKTKRKIYTTAENVVSKGAKAMGLTARIEQICFDIDAAIRGWDVRDPRGRSARVFAPGSTRRERREKYWHEKVDNVRRIAVGAGVLAGVSGLAGGYMLGKKLTKQVATPVIKRGVKKKAGEAVTNIVPVPRSVFNSHSMSSNGSQINFGIRNIKSGKMAGQVVKWGKDLPHKMPVGYHAPNWGGVMQIHDPATNANMTIQRGIDRMAHNNTNWVKGKNAYIANINVPKEHRNTVAGGKSIQKMTSGVFEHFDRRGIRANTVAGAYEKSDPMERMKDTHKLIQGYQKRGFKIDSKAGAPNEWNVTMTRKPGAERVKPISEGRFNAHVEKKRENAMKISTDVLSHHVRAIAPGSAAIIGGTAAAGYGASKRKEENGNQISNGAIAAGVGGVGIGALGIKRGIDKTHREIGVHTISGLVDHVKAASNFGRISVGKTLSKQKNTISRYAGKQILGGLVKA